MSAFGILCHWLAFACSGVCQRVRPAGAAELQSCPLVVSHEVGIGCRTSGLVCDTLPELFSPVGDGAYAKVLFLSRTKKTGTHRDQPPAEERRAVRGSPAFRKTPRSTTTYLREQQTIPKSTEQPSPRLDSDPHEAVWPRVNRALQDIPGDVSPGWPCGPRDDCGSTRGSCLPTVRLTGQRSSAQIPKSTSKRCLRLSPTAPPSNRIFTT